MTLVRLIARPMLSTVFIAAGANAVKNPEPLAGRAQPIVDQLLPYIMRATTSVPIEFDSKRLVQANGALHVLAGALLASGKSPRLASLALAGSLVPTTLGGHRFWEESDPTVRATQRLHFLKNVSLVGGLLIASVDTAGKPSLAWRAQRGAERAKKRAKELTPN